MTNNVFKISMKDGKPTGNIITPVFRGSYVQLFTARAVKGGKPEDAAFSMAMLFPKTTDFAPLKELVMAVAKEKWGGKAEDVLRKQQNSDKRIFKDQGDQQGEGFEDGCIYLSARNKKKPAVVGRKAGPDGTLIEITDEEKVWSGCYFIASLRPFAWEHPVGGKGVSLSLQNVQLFKEGDRLGGGRAKPSEEFEAGDDEDMSELDQAPADNTPPKKDPFA